MTREPRLPLNRREPWTDQLATLWTGLVTLRFGYSVDVGPWLPLEMHFQVRPAQRSLQR